MDKMNASATRTNSSFVGGGKRKRFESLQSNKGIGLDLILIEKGSVIHKSKVINSFSSAESIKEEKEKGFAFSFSDSFKKDE
jgi:hypothetical protein